MRKVVRDVVEVFGVHLQTQQRRVLGFDRAQVGLTLMFARARTDEFFVPQDAVSGAFADGQLEHVHQTAGAETWSFFARGDDLSGDLRGGALGAVAGAARVVGERIVSVFPAAEPEGARWCGSIRSGVRPRAGRGSGRSARLRGAAQIYLGRPGSWRDKVPGGSRVEFAHLSFTTWSARLPLFLLN